MTTITTTTTPHHPPKPPYNPLINPANATPISANNPPQPATHIFLARPLSGALLFDNLTSDARDHCANERTFLSWLRLAMYLGVVAIAIIISFHFQTPPTGLERRMALPLGIVFWLLSLTCLVTGFANYIRTVRKYSQQAALVQSGWKTQVMFTVVGTVILACCVLFLATDAKTSR